MSDPYRPVRAVPGPSGRPVPGDPTWDDDLGPEPTLVPLAQTSGTSTRPARSWFPLVAFLAVLAVLMLTVWQARVQLPESGEADFHPPVPHEEVLGGWLWFDASWYVDIAAHGYSDQQIEAFDAGQQSSVAFFPAYPIAVRSVAELTGLPIPAAAMLTTGVCGLLVALLFWTWCGRWLEDRSRRLALVLLLVYPYAWFLYASGYADALFLASVLGVCVLIDRDHPVAAGLLGIVTTAARPSGLPALAGLVAIGLDHRGILTRSGPTRSPAGEASAALGSRLAGWWRHERRRWRLAPARARLADAGILLAGLGGGTWMLYLQQRTGDALAFASVQAAPGWNQSAGPATWFKRAFFAHVWHDPLSFSGRLIAQAVLCLLFLACVPWVTRRFGWGYGCYVLLVVGVPAVGAADFQGVGRYLLAAFPVFALLGEACARRRRLERWLVPASAVALVALTTLFAQGHYLT
jgi:hypothetical protein